MSSITREDRARGDHSALAVRVTSLPVVYAGDTQAGGGGGGVGDGGGLGDGEGSGEGFGGSDAGGGLGD